MTCTEFENMRTNRNPFDCTTAERLAFANHSHKCVSCFARLHKEASEVMMKYPLEAARIIVEDFPKIDAMRAKDLQDPGD